MTNDQRPVRIEPRWWGWGDPAIPTDLPDRARLLLKSRGMTLGEPAPEPVLSDAGLPEPRVLPDSVVQAAGPTLDTGVDARIRHTGGHSLTDLLRRRAGEFGNAPDGVITPADETQILAVLRACGESKVAVVPWGGGTSVTGGLTVDEPGFMAVVALDLVNFRTVEVDVASRTARLGAGLRGPEAEAALNREGFTLGHFPQSFEFATVGGFAAARSAGQASSGYGRFDDMVTSVRLLSPTGEIQTLEGPRSSSGPSLREVVLGSEGTLGVITEVTVRIRPQPEASLYEAFMVRDFESGCSAARTLSQSDALPTVLRISDRDETDISIGMSRPDGVAGRAFDLWLRLRRRSHGALVIAGFEGRPSEVRARRATTRSVLRTAGAVSLGRAAGRSWSRNRFHGPYLREALLDHGLVVDTFETSAIWRDYERAYREIRDATTVTMHSAGMSGVVMCHLSHCYPESASLYFTVIATPGPEGSIESWRVVKTAAMDAISSAGLTVSHHHGVGRDHTEWLEGELGENGLAALRSLKAALDPSGIMNPGCLLTTRGSAPHTHR